MNDLTAWAIFGSGVLTGVILAFTLSAAFTLILGGFLFFRSDDVQTLDKVEGAA